MNGHDFARNYEILLNQMNFNIEDKKVTHNYNKNTPMLPFKTREPERVVFENGFYNILGEFTRLSLDKTWVDGLDINQIIQGIVNDDVEVDDEDEKYLEKLLKEYLFNEKGELKILNPYLFLYIPLNSNKRSIGQKDIALFFRDVFSKDNPNIANFFKNNEPNHIIINLILNNISDLEDKNTDIHYMTILDNIVELFNEDMNFAVKHEKFLIENIGNIFAYYYFFYSTQLILKLSKDFNSSHDEIEKLYYLLDWESIWKKRKTLDKGTSYSWVREKSMSLLPKVGVIDQLNTLLGTQGCLLPDMLDFYEDLDLGERDELLVHLRRWVYDYRYVRNFEEMDLPNDFKELINILFNSLNDNTNGMDPATKSRYAKNLEEVAKKYFAKRRGSYGYVLNINRDMLIAITALCVKDEKIKLKQLFEEYEKRGLFFDRYSQEKVVDFLTKLNLIDKKSDSGDAQYVKPVL